MLDPYLPPLRGLTHLCDNCLALTLISDEMRIIWHFLFFTLISSDLPQLQMVGFDRGFICARLVSFCCLLCAATFASK